MAGRTRWAIIGAGTTDERLSITDEGAALVVGVETVALEASAVIEAAAFFVFRLRLFFFRGAKS